jgi:hypothetical protein
MFLLRRILGSATFDEIVRQINNLTSLYAKYQDKIKSEASIPSDLFKAFQNLRFLLDAAKLDLIQSLRIGLFSSPPFRQFCCRELQDPRTSMIRAKYQAPRQNHDVK